MGGGSLSEDDTDEDASGVLAAVPSRLRDVWTFVHGFHRGYAHVGDIRDRRETRDEDDR